LYINVHPIEVAYSMSESDSERNDNRLRFVAAVDAGNTEEVQRFLQQADSAGTSIRVHLNDLDEGGCTALGTAVQQGNVELVLLLLKASFSSRKKGI
jgi:hypothetical protein